MHGHGRTKLSFVILVSLLILAALSVEAQKKPQPAKTRPASPSTPKIARVPIYNLHLKISDSGKLIATIISPDQTDGLDPSALSALITDLPTGGDKFNTPNNSFPKVTIEASPNIAMLDLWNPITLFRRDRTDITLMLSLGVRGTQAASYPVPVLIPWKSEDLSPNLKPNPLFLVVTVTDDGTLELNTEPTGSLSDPEPLSKRLRELFREREANGVFRPGSNDVEKSVTIVMPMGPRKVADLITVASAVWAPGGKPISLAMDSPMARDVELEMPPLKPRKPF